jgi:cell division protein FtsN
MSLIIALILVLVVATLITKFYPTPKKTELIEEQPTEIVEPTPMPSWVNEIKFESETVVTPEPSVVEKIVKKVTKKKPTSKNTAKVKPLAKMEAKKKSTKK